MKAQWYYVAIRHIGEGTAYLDWCNTEEEAWEACAKDECHPENQPLYTVAREKKDRAWRIPAGGKHAKS